MKKSLILGFVLALCMAFVPGTFALANDVSAPCGFEDDAYICLDTVTVTALESVYRVDAGNFADGYGAHYAAYKTKAMFSNGMFYQDYLSQNTNKTQPANERKNYLYYAQKGDLVVVKIRVTRRYREIIEFVENLSLH